MNTFNDLGSLLLNLPIYLANGCLVVIYWLVANSSALLSILCACLLAFGPDLVIQHHAARPVRGNRQVTGSTPVTAQVLTGLVLVLWIIGQWGMAAPVPWIGAVMWLAGLVVVWILQAQQYNVLWFVKSGIAIYSLAVIASRVYLSYTAQLSAEEWAAVIGSSQSASAVIANTRGNMTTIVLWALWLVIPLGYFSMLFQQLFLNPMPLSNPLSGAQKALGNLRYRGGR